MIPNALNKEILFNEKDHIYTDKNGKELISVTTVIKKFSNPFDPNGHIARACARRDGFTVKEQLQIWEDNREVASIKGKKFHSDIENYINFGIIPENENKSYVEQFSKIEFNGPIQSEVLLYSHKHGIAGTTDLIEFRSKACNVWDFKTNKELHWENKYKKFMLPPFEYLDDINTVHYSIQLSVYARLLEEMGYWTDKLNIIYVNNDNQKLDIIPIKFMDKEARLILKLARANPTPTPKPKDTFWDF